jgi:uncharacterized integral membrane protein
MRSRRINMRTLKLYLYGLLVLLFAIFILQNYPTLTYSVALRLNLGFLSLVSIPLPLFLIAPLFFFCGLFLATIIGSGERRRLSREIKQLKSSRPEPKQESRPEPRPEPQPAVRQEYKAEPKPESDSKKKPDEGTIVSSGPLVKKVGAPEESKPPFRS